MGREGTLGCVTSFSFFVVVFVGSSLFSSFGSFLYKGKQAFLKNNKRRGKKKSLPPPKKTLENRKKKKDLINDAITFNCRQLFTFK